MKKYKQLKLEQTCGACPEQYDVFFEDENIGYLRLRHGYFSASYKGKSVYSANTIGDGMFDTSERKKHLKKAKKAIYKSMMKSQWC
ncbi:hypothetical protein N9933_03455 [bacterium]|nr:hypothetical protein [bacterium]